MSLYFLMNCLRMNVIILMRRPYVGDLNFRVPFKKGKFDLDIFTFKEPTKNLSQEDLIQEPLIDILFEDLFKEELMCLDEPTRDDLIKCTSLGESLDLSFKDMYETELEFLGFIVRKFQLRSVMVINF